MWCDFTCSNHQADYVEINSFIPPENEFIKDVKFILTQKFQNDFWQCCKRNVLGTVYIENQYVNIRAFLPGVIGEQQPPPNPYVGFRFLNEGDVYNPPGYIGNTTACESSCSCQYCEAACNNPKYKPLVPDFSCRMFGIQCYIVFIVGFSIISILVTIATLCGIIGKIAKKTFPPANIIEEEDDISTTISDTCINNESTKILRRKYSTF